ncbi:MAG: hypothetical protein KDA58_17015, partial [Planctomycetaceae bacterium]|nr:hypothetical protein [Planctomycetaceae bacterium]
MRSRTLMSSQGELDRVSRHDECLRTPTLAASDTTRRLRPSMLLLVALLTCCPEAHAQKQHAPIRDDIPYGVQLQPRQEEPVFAVCSKQGMRVLVSRDDGRTWKQTFLGTDSLEDGGWHGTFAVYGMAATGGVIGVFSGWGTPGVYIGSDDGVHWSHLV